MPKKRIPNTVTTALKPTGLALDPFLMRHLVTGPESPQRLIAIQQALQAANLLNRLTPIQPRTAANEEICLIHSPAYFQLVHEDIQAGSPELSTGDTELSPQSLEVALRATGTALQAVDDVMSGKIQNAFCALRPPGHHASPAMGMGFCIFNHIAIAARYALKKWDARKILIVDWDVHHGNGTQTAFYRDPAVLFFSSHQSPLYPGTGRRAEIGAGKARGNIINAPLPAGSGYSEILGEIETRLERKIQTFKPDLIFISAGFDSRINDPLGDFTLTDEQFALLMRRVMDWARDYAAGRIVSLLEGGYNLQTLGKAVAAHVSTLADGVAPPSR